MSKKIYKKEAILKQKKKIAPGPTVFFSYCQGEKNGSDTREAETFSNRLYIH